VSKLENSKKKQILWHRRLCHRSIKYIEKNLKWIKGTGLQSSDFVRGEIDDSCHCDACARTKSTVQPRKVHSRRDRRNHDGEVSTDLYGPFPEPTIHGSFHLQGFIRIASGFINLYGCTKKNASCENLRKYLKEWPPPKTNHYHSDGARELVGADIQQILDSYTPRIGMTFSTPYSPNQNTFAERMWRTLSDMAHPNLVMANLPFRFIEDAMIYASWIHNRLPRQTDKGWMSPYEYEFNILPDLSMARRWGCICYYHIPEALRRKGMIENGVKGYFIGISEKQPYGWLVWDPKLNETVTSSNVNFIESLGEVAPTKSDKIREVDFYSREFAEESKTPEDFYHLIGVRYFDYDEREAYETTGVVRRGQVIVANRKKVVRGKTVGSEADNHPVHVRDVELMVKLTKERRNEDLCAAAVTRQMPAQRALRMPPGLEKNLPDVRSDQPQHDEATPSAVNSEFGWRRGDDEVVLPTDHRSRGEVPKSIKTAMLSNSSRKWYSAMKDEIDCIATQKKVWYPWRGRIPPGVKPLGTRFVFKVKEKESPEDDIYRARLVVQGFEQRYGIDYDETFSPTTKANSLRLFLYFVLLYDMTLPIHLDAVKAYMNSDIDTDIWVYPPNDPDEIFFKRGMLFKLKKALYGLKQSGRLWHKLIDEMLKKLGFKNLKSEPCFYYSVIKNVLTFIIIYVDDVLITSQSPEVRDILINKMMETFDFTNEGVVSEFLGIRIAFSIDKFNRFITLDQEKMILDKVEEFNLADEKLSHVPMNPAAKLTIHDEPAPPGTPYREMVGSALHIARWTRCDIANTVSQLSRYNAKPTRGAAVAAARLWAYLRATARLKFTLSLSNVRKSNFQMIGYSDSDWAGDIDTRRSTTGWMVFIGVSLISWIAQLQSFIAQSSMEAETIAANKLLNELLYLQGLFKEAGLLPESQSKTPVMIDNEAAIKSAYNPVGQGKTKHFDIQEFHLRENTTAGRVIPTKIGTLYNPADILTKALFRPTLEAHRKRAGIIELPPNAKRAKDDADWKLAAQSSGGVLSGRSPSPHVSNKDALFAPPSVGGGVQGGPDKDFD
jgi:hypothetical protein